MKNLLFAALAATVLSTSVGCCCGQRSIWQPWGCGGCGCDSCGGGCDSCGCGGGGCGCGGGGCGGGCSSCGCGGGSGCGCDSCGYSSRFGYSGGGYGAARYTNGGPPSGCACGRPWLSNQGYANAGCQSGGPGFGLACCGGPGCNRRGPQGPPMAQMPYPYYTTRGPRDFLAKNPPSIGP